MKHRINLRTLAGLLLASALVPSAQARLSSGDMASFGGDWSSQCGSAVAPTLRVEEDKLSFSNNPQQIAATDPVASRSYFGQNPPQGHRAVLIGQGPNNAEMLFIVTGVGKKAFIKVDGSQAVRSALGPRWLAEKFRRCEGSVGVAKADAGPAGPATPPR